MAKIKLSEAKLADVALLRGFEQGVITAERPYNENLKQGVIHYYDLESLIEGDESIVLLAKINRRIIGCGSAELKKSQAYLDHEKHAYLGFMFVEPEQRGKGINKLIMTALFEWANAKGVNDFYLDVYDGNSPAIRAYEKIGFKKSLVEMKFRSD